MYCKYCGEKIQDKAAFCVRCGKPVENLGEISRTTTPGKGSSIASMVLGILGLLSAIMIFLTSGLIHTIFNYTDEYYDDVHDSYVDFEDFEDIYNTTFKVSVPVTGAFYVLPLSVTGFCLAISSKKKIQNGFNKSGYILNFIALALFAINVIWVIII